MDRADAGRKREKPSCLELEGIARPLSSWDFGWPIKWTQWIDATKHVIRVDGTVGC